jgi:hypothetical protein
MDVQSACTWIIFEIGDKRFGLVKTPEVTTIHVFAHIMRSVWRSYGNPVFLHSQDQSERQGQCGVNR